NWSVDSKRIFFTTEDRGRTTLQMMPITGGAARILISGSGHIDDVQFPNDGKTMIYTESNGAKPTELYKVPSSGGAAKSLGGINDSLLSDFALPSFEDFWVTGAEETKVHSFVLKPPDFRPNRKYPVLFLIHGGPQGAWEETWSYRWNAQVFAAAGFVVVMPNP